MVIFLGPLFSYSNFVFESGNGYLVRLIRGTRSIINEIATKYRTIKSASKYFLAGNISPAAAKFCSDVMNFDYSKSHEECDGVYLTGSTSVVRVTEEECLMLQESDIPVSENNQVKCYNWIIRDRILYSCNSYTKAKVFNDSCVMLTNGTYATTDKNLKSSSQTLHCVLKPIRIVQGLDIIPQIKRCAFDLYDKGQLLYLSLILQGNVF